MKRLFLIGMFVLMFLVVAPHVVSAQYAAVNVSYLWGTKTTEFKSSSNFFGRSLETNGIDIDGVVIGDSHPVVLEGRFQNLPLRNARFFSHNPEDNTRHEYVLTNFSGGNAQYYEVSSNFVLSRQNHFLIAGAAALRFTENFRNEDRSGRFTSTLIGPVFGAAHVRQVGGMVFNYSGRVYPRLIRTNKFVSSGGDSWKSNGLTNAGYELRGTGTYSVSARVGVTGGYYYRRIRQSSPTNGPMSEHETLLDHGFIVGVPILFFSKK